MSAPPALMLPQSWKLPEQVRHRVGRNYSGRQRTIFECGHLLLILHKAPNHHGNERETRFFWRRPNANWCCSEGGDAMHQLQRHLDEYEDVEEDLAARYAVATCAADYFGILEEAVPLARSARNMYAALQTARDSVPEDSDLVDLRNRAVDVDRAMELLLQDSKNALDFDIARTAEEQARFSQQTAEAGHRLNILASLFFPLTAFASIFGMNLPTGLEDTPIWVSWLVMGAGILTGYVVLSWVNRSTQAPAPPQPTRRSSLEVSELLAPTEDARETEALEKPPTPRAPTGEG